MARDFVERELVGGPKDGHRILVGKRVRELYCLGFGGAARIATKPADGLQSLAPLSLGRYVLAESGDLTWEGHS